MAQAQNANARSIIQSETTFGTDPGTPNVELLYLQSNTLIEERNQLESVTARSGRNPLQPALGNKNVTGQISMELQAYACLPILGVMGSVTTTGASPYVHTFKIGTTLKSFMIERGFPDLATAQYFKYNGATFNSLSLDFTSEGYPVLVYELFGKKETVGTSSFDATATDNGWMPFHGGHIGTMEEGGSAIATITNVSGFTISNNLDTDDFVIDTSNLNQRRSLPAGKVTITGTVTALFETIALYNKAVNETESSLKITYARGNGLGSAGNESIEFHIEELTYAKNAPVMDGPTGGVLVNLPFTGFYVNGSNASALQIIVKNTLSSVA